MDLNKDYGNCCPNLLVRIIVLILYIDSQILEGTGDFVKKHCERKSPVPTFRRDEIIDGNMHSVTKVGPADKVPDVGAKTDIRAKVDPLTIGSLQPNREGSQK